MKKLFSLVAIILTMAMIFACVPAYGADGDVEIKFSVGDSTLMINGAPVTVQTPYVVGKGTTLVPVRVITEAFGAKVDWDNTAKAATLTYNDVKIYLQIGNNVAEVNGQAEKLDAAPELTNNTTMVPLRFISETFDAKVSYDETTKGITVVKSASGGGSTVESGINSKNIGDSYYSWVMEKPAEMQMDYRSFDGSYTSFMFDDNNYITIDIYGADPEYDLEEDFADAKSSVSGLTLIKAEKSSDTNYSRIHIQCKNQLYYYDIQRVVTDKYDFQIIGNFENTDTKKRDMWLKTLSTFKPQYNGTDTYDMSNIKDGMRTYEAEDINLKFNVPQELYVASSDYAVNEFDFYSLSYNDNFSEMHVGVYSKSDAGSAKELAEKDFEGNRKAFSPEIMKYSDSVIEKQYNSIKAYEYSFDYTSSVESGYNRDVFFELGDYVYNFAISLNSSFGDTSAYVDKIINSIEAKPIDSSEVGILLRNTPDDEGTYTSEPTGFKLTVPKIYEEEFVSGGVMYQNRKNAVTIAFMGSKYTESTYAEEKKTLKNLENSYKEIEDVEIVTPTSDITINGTKYAYMLMREKTDAGYYYTESYVAVKNNSLLRIVVYYPETSFFEGSQKEVKDIITSIK